MRLSPEAAQVVARIVKIAAGMAEDRKILGLLLDATASFFSCERGAIFVYSRRGANLVRVRSLRPAETWDPATLLSFFRNEKPALPPDIIMAPVRAGSEVIGVLALGKRAGFEPGAGKVATEMLKIAGAIVGERRRRKALEIACGVGGALARGLRPKDAIYRILHGARRLIDFDHGAIVFARVNDRSGQVVAQQVAWAAGKGSLVGRRIAIDWGELPKEIVVAGGLRGELGGDIVLAKESDDREQGGDFGADRGLHRSRDAAEVGGSWDAILALNAEGAPEKKSRLLLPLTGAHGPVGLLEIASSQEGFFRASDVDAARILAPYLVLCLSGIDSPGGR